MTGLPDDLAQLAAPKGNGDDRSPAAGNESASVGRTAASDADRWGVSQLAASGEEAIGRILLPQYLLLALSVLLPPLGTAVYTSSRRACIPLILHRLLKGSNRS